MTERWGAKEGHPVIGATVKLGEELMKQLGLEESEVIILI
jgi:hypothetical protein